MTIEPDRQYAYDTSFMSLSKYSSQSSADHIIQSLIVAPLAVASVLDIGCGPGTWLAAWRRRGATDIHGVDGPYVRASQLDIEPHFFTPADLSGPLDLARRFDLVQSLEVAEHIASAASETFIKNLTGHSNGLVLFSAAPPGQGGEFHVNERSYEFWRGLFREHGYRPFDYVRPLIGGVANVSYWYRYNIVLYVRDDRIGGLPAAIACTRVPDGTPIPDVSPVLFKLRKAVLARMPPKLQNELSRLKSRLARTNRY